MDTLVTTVLMMVVWCVTHPNITKRHVIAAGLGLGLAGMITIKAAFYVPTITVILLIRWWANQWHRKHLLEGFSIGLLALGSFTTLYFLHSTSLNAPISGTNYIESVASGSLGSFGLLPQRFTLVMSLLQNPFHWVLLACGIVCVGAATFKSDRDVAKSIILLSFALPLLTLVFYLHSYAYYYVFIMAPASVLMAIAIDTIVIPRYKYFAPVMIVCALISFYPTANKSFNQTSNYQKQVVRAVRDIFPEPVPYIDRCGMIAGYDQAWFFMGSWQLHEYHKAGNSLIPNILTTKKPVFILANADGLDLDNLGPEKVAKRLLPEDEAALKLNYIHHWGPIYVPGKSFALASDVTDFNIAIDGTYTLESNASAEIDGVQYMPSAVVNLSTGKHRISTLKPGKVTLRWGDHLHKPTADPLGTKLFRGF